MVPDLATRASFRPGGRVLTQVCHIVWLQRVTAWALIS